MAFPSASRLFPLLILLALAACAAQSPASDAAARPDAAAHPDAATRPAGCSIRIIVAFSQSVQRPPDDALVKEVAHAAGVNLMYVRSVNPELHVFILTAADPVSGCDRGLERLRADSHVRSADIDARRKPQ